MNRDEYWLECIQEAASDAGVALTKEQAETMAGWVQGASENIGMAFYTPSETQYDRDLKQAKDELRRERAKVHCRECNGKGRIVSFGGTFEFNSQCWKCNGEGRHAP
jgi:DnaJ-class molecular chaperone